MEQSNYTRKYKRSEETIERVLEAAIDLFYEHGFAKTSTRQLVQKAGMSSSAIYNHFSNKHHILFTIIQRAGDKTLSMLERIIRQYDEPEECLRQMLSNLLYLFKDGMKKEVAIFIDELYQLPEDLRKICNKQHRQIFDLFESRIRELKSRDLANPINNKVATFGILGAMLWVYHWFRDSGSLTIEEISNELTALLFHGLLRERENASTESLES